jgi:stage II sporulation protein E
MYNKIKIKFYAKYKGGIMVTELRLEIFEKVFKKTNLYEKIKIKIRKEDVLTRIVGFFLAMAMPLPGIAPFGIAFLAQERRFSFMAVFTFLIASAGSLVACSRMECAKYIGAGAIYLCVLFILKKGVRLKDTMAAVMAGTAVFATGLSVLIMQGFSVADFVLLLCEATLTVSGTFMMEKSVTALKSNAFDFEKTDADTKISLFAVTMIALLGFKELYLGSELSVMNSIATALLLAVSSRCGARYSTGAGVILGLVCGIGGDFFMPILGAFSFCGFLAGAFSKFGKGGTIAGIILANGIMTVYTNNAMEAVLSIWEILAAGVVFFVVPEAWIEWVRSIVSFDKEEREGIAKVKQNIKCRLHSAAQAFDSISKTIQKLSVRDEEESNDEISIIFDATADKVCSKCRKCTVCWGQNYNSTYNEMFSILKVMKETGTAKIEDVSDYFVSKCININAFLEELNHRFDMYRVRQSWKSKLSESRQILGKQFGGVSEILEGIKTELEDNSKTIAVSEAEIRGRLSIAGIKTKTVQSSADKYGRHRIEIVLKTGRSQGKTRKIIEKVIKTCTACNVMHKEEMPQDKKYVKLIFTESKRFEVETESATMAASRTNGDNFRFLNLESGKFIIAMSDGMGTGSRAAKESEAILELLDSFLQAGFEAKVAIRLINSIMIIKSEESAFVTLDLCIIDLYTGKVKFVKTGAEPSFILSDSGRVRTINASSLPVGLIADAEAEISDTKVQDGDRIVMVTDGVENRENGSVWIREFVKNTKNINEDTNLAQKILDHAARNSGDTAKDDMTVLSVKLKAVS